jgi:hypothetical protein
MTAPLTGAADAADVPASPMPATVIPTIKIVRICECLLQRLLFPPVPPPTLSTGTLNLVPGVLLSRDAHRQPGLLTMISAFRRVLRLSVVHLHVVSFDISTSKDIRATKHVCR